jgi:hypothetical protein
MIMDTSNCESFLTGFTETILNRPPRQNKNPGYGHSGGILITDECQGSAGFQETKKWVRMTRVLM